MIYVKATKISITCYKNKKIVKKNIFFNCYIEKTIKTLKAAGFC